MGVNIREVDGKGWYVFINWRNQRKAKSFGSDKVMAKAFAKKLSARLKWAEVSGEPIALSQPDQQLPTVKAYLEEWLLTHAKMHCKPSTYRRYKEVIDQQLIPAFGERPLHLLRRSGAPPCWPGRNPGVSHRRPRWRGGRRGTRQA